MKFIVRWKQEALDDLARMWLAADSWDRERITAAARDVDRLLQFDPYTGESRPEDRRVMFLAPLGVSFRVHARGKKVEVRRVWQFY